MVKAIKCILILLLMPFGSALAQIPEDVKLTIERYLETLETNADYTQIYEDLIVFTEKPLNLNHVGVDDLINFPLITPVQAAAIVSHRRRFGLFLQLAELQVVGMEPEQIRAIAPFVNISPGLEDRVKGLAEKLQKGKAEVILTTKRRYPDPKETYNADLMAMSTRLRYTLPGVYSFGITAEKDPGEYWWNRGPDYLSAHAAIFNFGAVKSLVAGDYVLSMGQGLVMGAGIGIGKSASVLNIKRSQPMVKAYRGVNEFLFLRGAAATLKLGQKWDFTIALASNGISARLGDTAGLGGEGFSSVDLDGLHRTSNEIENKNNLRRNLQGYWLQRNGKTGSFGGGASLFSSNLQQSKSEDLYRLYNPTGKKQHFYHGWQAHTLGRLHVFSEWAWMAQTRRHAISAGALISLGKWAEWSLHLRDYAPGFVSPYSTAFGNANQNEQGLYMGLKMNFSRKLSLSNYCDIARQPWLTFRFYAPSRTQDLLWQLDYAATKKTQLYVRYRYITRSLQSNEATTKSVTSYTTHLLRVNINAAVTQSSRVELRAEHSFNADGPSAGHSSLFYGEYTTRINPGRWQLVMRYSMFDVSGFYNRLYAYENQLLYDFGTVAFFGKGRSAYLLATKPINKRLKAGLRYAWMESINSGDVLPTWNRRIFAQLIWRI
jgi:hypothetical protein